VYGGSFLPLHPDNATFLDSVAVVTKVVTALLIINSVGTRQANENTLPQQSSSSKNQMRVLSRKVGEKLVIDGNITVEVVKIQGNRITLGLVAPSNVKILRGELNQKQAAVQVEETPVVSKTDQLLRQAC